ncbi:MAG TPA: SWIM zinc finger family protein [Pirellulales bacterium]
MVNLTLEQVEEMAPDAASAAAGKKLVGIKHWPELGRSSDALWGKCQGSAVYQVKIDLSNLGYNCSCPSRKFPCKHVLGLLMLAVQSPAAVTETNSPDWVDDWLAKRRARDEKRGVAEKEPLVVASTGPVDQKAKEKRAEQRGANVRDGLSRLDLWMKDLVRSGLAAVETQPASLWDEQAKRLVDAQAPGLASRVARLASIPRSSPDWVGRLLAELGRIQWLIHAHNRLDALDPLLAGDIRQILGWNVSQADLDQSGDVESDRWVVVGQWVDDDERVRAQRSWVVGRNTGRWGLLLQFSVGGQPFPESIVAGTEQAGRLMFYPGAARLRAKFAQREGAVTSLVDRPPGFDTIGDFLDHATAFLAKQPWLDAFGGVLRDATLVPADTWLLRDRTGHALPLRGSNHWKAVAITGGHPCDLAFEWDGHCLRPLGLVIAGQYWSA